MFPIYVQHKEIQSGAVAKSNVRKGFLIYQEMRKYLPIYEEAVSHIWLCNCSILNFLMYEESFIFFFISVPKRENFDSDFFYIVRALSGKVTEKKMEVL